MAQDLTYLGKLWSIDGHVSENKSDKEGDGKECSEHVGIAVWVILLQGKECLYTTVTRGGYRKHCWATEGEGSRELCGMPVFAKFNIRKCDHFVFKPRQQPTLVIVPPCQGVNASVLTELEHTCDASNLIVDHLTNFDRLAFITVNWIRFLCSSYLYLHGGHWPTYV